jgi:hypothetical protein
MPCCPLHGICVALALALRLCCRCSRQRGWSGLSTLTARALLARRLFLSRKHKHHQMRFLYRELRFSATSAREGVEGAVQS